jgi:hypothetical protein
MSDILDRLRARVHPHFFTNAVAANLGACAVNPAVIHAQTGTVTIGGPDKDMQDAIAEIERLRACISDGAKWVPVKERTPSNADHVLVATDLYKYPREAIRTARGWLIEGNEWFDSDTDGHVTHWMPLPEPPK